MITDHELLMVFFLVFTAPAYAVSAHNLRAAVAKGRGPEPTVVLVLPGFGATPSVPVATCPGEGDNNYS